MYFDPVYVFEPYISKIGKGVLKLDRWYCIEN